MTIARRSFIEKVARTSLLGLVPAIAKGSVRAPQPVATANEEHRFLTPPYLQDVTDNSITVMWITARNCYSWIEYGTEQQLGKKTDHATDGLVDANNKINKVVINGLAPDTTYYYKVCSKEIVEFLPYKLTYGAVIESSIHSFKTIDPAANEVSWLILNDIHDRPASFPHLLGLNKDPYDFVFLNGDMFDYQTDEQQMIDHLLTPLTTAFASDIPFLYTRGNHETRGKFARQHVDYVSCPDDRYYFSFTRGPVHFIVLDTGEDKEDDHKEYSSLAAFDAYRIKQAKWLEEEIKTKAFKQAPFRVVMMHIPLYHSGEGHGSLHCRELFNPLFNKGKIDLFVAGHTHKYGTYDADPATHNYPIVIGGGPLEGKRTLIKVKAGKDALTLQMLGDDGTEVGGYHLKRR